MKRKSDNNEDDAIFAVFSTILALEKFALPKLPLQLLGVVGNNTISMVNVTLWGMG